MGGTIASLPNVLDPHVLPLADVVGLIRPSTRHRIEVPWIDPCWVVPPPPKAVQPREMVRYRSQTKGTGTKRTFGLVRLINGKLHLLE